MIREIIARYKQGYQTFAYPEKPVSIPERFRGYPELTPAKTREENERHAASCPFNALTVNDLGLALDMGRCLFCADCQAGEAVTFTSDPVLAATKREDLIVRSGIPKRAAGPLPPDLLRLFKRSLKFREVSAGGCNACEADTNVLNTPFFDLSRFGIDFVASPRHADGIHVTGPITRNMQTALLDTYAAVPAPKVVIASGCCSISGGPFHGSSEIVGDLNTLIPVDLYIPGCPPHPLTTLHALLAFFKK